MRLSSLALISCIQVSKKMTEENKYSRVLHEKLKALVTSEQLNGIWLGEESMGYDIQLAFSNTDTKNAASLDEVDERQLKQIFHDWAWDNAGDLDWGFYRVSMDEDSSVKVITVDADYDLSDYFEV